MRVELPNRGIALALVLTLLLAPLAPVAPVGAEHGQTTGEPGKYTVGRSVDNVSVQASQNALSIEVTDSNPAGTTLNINRSWLQSQIGRPIEFTRFSRNGELIDTYQLTSDHVIIDIPHFSTQNITATAVDAQFEVTGSATGSETTRIINYDVDETGIAVLEIHGQGTEEGTKRVDQFFSQVDNSTFTWSTGEIPRNVTLKLTGHGEKFGPPYNKTHSAVGDDSTVFFDLAAKDYNTNVTITGSGQEIGTPVTKGPFLADGDGDTQSISFANEQSNESIVFIGNTSVATQNHQREEGFDLDNSTNSANVTVENGKLVLNTSEGIQTIDDFSDGDISEYSGDTSQFQVSASVPVGVLQGSTDGRGVDYTIQRTDVNVGQGDNITYTAYHPGIGNIADQWTHTGFIFGVQDANNFYLVRFTSTQFVNSNSIQLVEVSGGSYSVLASARYDLDGSAPVEIHWGSSGTIEVTVGDIWPTQTITHTTTTYTSGGFGWYVGQMNNGTNGGYGPLEVGDDLSATVSSSADSGYYERQYTTTELAEEVRLNWNDDETNGSVQWFAKTDNNGYVEWTDAENDTLKDIADGQDVWVRANLTRSAGDGPSVDHYEVTWQTTSTQQTTDPAIDVDGDGNPDASVSGTIPDGTSVTKTISASLSDGSHTFWVNTSAGSIVDWRYEGNNDARTHVQNFSLNGVDHSVDEFLADGQNTTISVPNTDTLPGQNSLMLRLYDDTEASQASRIDIRGEYEDRSVLDNVTVNGNTRNLDAVLADGQSTSLDVTSDAVYGDNNVRVQLEENSTQDNYDAEFFWYPENRTTFSNVTVNGQTFDGADEYNGVPYNVTFLGNGGVLTFNVTGALQTGSNEHVFRMLAPRTTTDSIDFVEKMEFEKNVTILIEERAATYNKSTTETFDHKVTSGATFNFSTPDRVIRIVGTKVTFDGTTSAQNSTAWNGDKVTVTVDESIPAGTEVDVRVELLKYNVTNADDYLRAESDLDEDYMVDVGLSSITGNVSYLTVEEDLTHAEWEILLTQNGNPLNETTDKVVFANGNVTIPEAFFNSSVSGLIVERPRYSKHTYTGTVNTIHPTVQIEPDRDVTHDPALYTESDESYEAMKNYSVSNIDSEIQVEWKQVGPYHHQWVTSTSDSDYNQTVVNFSTENVAVFADGQLYNDFSLSSGDLTIHSDSKTSATWDIYQYENLTVVGDPTFAIEVGQTKSVQVEVHNPNDFTVHDTRLELTHGWIQSVEPAYQDIPAGSTATYNVTIHVPAGSESTEYTIPMKLSSLETGEIDAKDLTVDTSATGLIAAGQPISNLVIIVAVVILFGTLILVQLGRSGELGNIRSEVEKIHD